MTGSARRTPRSGWRRSCITRRRGASTLAKSQIKPLSGAAMSRARKPGPVGAGVVVLVLVLAAASAAGCGAPGSSGPSGGSGSGPIEIAVVDAQSGQASSLGQWEYDGVKLAVPLANAAGGIDRLNIPLTLLRDQADPTVTADIAPNAASGGYVAA